MSYPLPSGLGNDTVTVLKRAYGPTPNRLGEFPLISTPTVVTGCSVQPNSVDEVISDKDFTVAMWLVFAPVTPIFTALTALDAISIVIDTTPTVFEDFGDPVLWTDLDGRPDHYRIKLRKARG